MQGLQVDRRHHLQHLQRWHRHLPSASAYQKTKLHSLVPPDPEFAPPVETEATPDEVMSCPSDPVMVVVLKRQSKLFSTVDELTRKW
jgi:hypothetical protein